MDNNKVLAMPQQQAVAPSYTNEQVQLIKDMYAKGATNDELKLLMYMSNKYGLDVLTRQIWCVKFGDKPAQIYSGRDGFLEIAHRSGQFDGMDTKVEKIDEPFEVSYMAYENGKRVTKTFKSDYQYVAKCTVYKKDMEHPITVEVYEEEYSTGQNLWQTKRRTMTAKVAESQCLRKAFSITGIYSPEEMSQWEEEQKPKPANEPVKTVQDVLMDAGRSLVKAKGWKGAEIKENMSTIFKAVCNKEKSTDLTDEEAEKAIQYITDILAGKVEYPPTVDEAAVTEEDFAGTPFEGNE